MYSYWTSPPVQPKPAKSSGRGHASSRAAIRRRNKEKLNRSKSRSSETLKILDSKVEEEPFESPTISSNNDFALEDKVSVASKNGDERSVENGDKHDTGTVNKTGNVIEAENYILFESVFEHDLWKTK